MDKNMEYWAIIPSELNKIRSYAKVAGSFKAAIREIYGQAEREDYEVITGVAIIHASGVICDDGLELMEVCETVEKAIKDVDVKKILLVVDSGGGMVQGTKDAADYLLSLRGVKPLIAYTDSTMASAAYWFSAACDEIYCSATACVGSIGIVAQHTDISKMHEMMGISIEEVYSGKYKRITSNYAPLTQEGRAYMQERTDYYYGIMMSDIALYRGYNEAKVLNMADGATFIGKQALSIGLVDGILSLPDMLKKLAGEALLNNDRRSNIMAEKNEAGIIAESADAKDVYAEAFKNGAKAEAARIKDVLSLKLQGFEDMVDAMAFDGVTTPAEAAVKIIQASKAQADKQMSALTEDAAEVNGVAASFNADDVGAGDFMALVNAKVHEGMTTKDAMSAVAKAHPNVHKAYIQGGLK